MTYDERVALIQAEFPKFKVKAYTDNWIFHILWANGIRMGATTIWNTVFIDPAQIGTSRGEETLQHEIVHVRDQHKYHVLFFLTYLLVLPVGPSFKAFWEWRAYRVNLRNVWEQYRAFSDPAYRDYIVGWTAEWVAQQFWRGSYLWMWPFPKMVRGWCAKEIQRLQAETSR